MRKYHDGSSVSLAHLTAYHTISEEQRPEMLMSDFQGDETKATLGIASMVFLNVIPPSHFYITHNWSIGWLLGKPIFASLPSMLSPEWTRCNQTVIRRLMVYTSLQANQAREDGGRQADKQAYRGDGYGRSWHTGCYGTESGCINEEK